MSNRLIKFTAGLVGFGALVAALPASADIVTMQARSSGDPGATSSADYVTAWNAVLSAEPTPPAGYADQVIADWNGNQSNSITGGGASTDLAYHDTAVFTVGAGDAGTWSFRLGIDFGFGGTLLVDGHELQTNTNDMWWNHSFSDPSQFLQGSIVLGAGIHTLDVYGFEGCCDGGTTGQYLAPDSRDFRDFTTTVPEPATWGLMIAGFGGLGVALRRRRAMVAA